MDDTLIYRRKVELIRPPETRDIVVPIVIILLFVSMIIAYQKAQSEIVGLQIELRTANKNVETKTAENTVLTNSLKELKADIQRIETRYEGVVQKSMAMIQENKDQIKNLETTVEDLKTKNEFLQAKVTTYEKQLQDQTQLKDF